MPSSDPVETAGRLLPPWPVLAALLMAALSYGIISTRFESPRPEIQSLPTLPGTNRTVHAHLWEDPVEIIPENIVPDASEEIAFKHLLDYAKPFVTADKAKRTDGKPAASSIHPCLCKFSISARIRRTA